MKKKLVILLAIFIIIWSLKERNSSYHNVINNYLKLDIECHLQTMIDNFGLKNDYDGIQKIIIEVGRCYESFKYDKTREFGEIIIEEGHDYNINQKYLNIISLTDQIEFEITINSENMKFYADDNQIILSTSNSYIFISDDAWKIQVSSADSEKLYFGTPDYRIGITIEKSIENMSIIYKDDYYYYFSQNKLLVLKLDGKEVTNIKTNYSKDDIETMMYVLAESLT